MCTRVLLIRMALKEREDTDVRSSEQRPNRKWNRVSSDGDSLHAEICNPSSCSHLQPPNDAQLPAEAAAALRGFQGSVSHTTGIQTKEVYSDIKVFKIFNRIF